MEYAIHSITGKKVWASNPAVTRGPYYICPICRAPVHLRRGSKVPHFAHNSKQAKSNCELYFSIDTEGISQIHKESEAPYRSLGLYLRLIDDQNQTIGWSLEVSIPEPDVDMGTIRLPFALGGLRTIPVSAIKSGGQRVRIPPGPGPFSLIYDNIPESRWRNRISHPIPGLSTVNLNVFRYSPFGGRRLNEDSPMYWGRAYVLIWTINSSPEWIPAKDIMQTVPLKGYTSWDGVYIELPERYNQQVEKWVTETTGRSIQHPPAELELIIPTAEYRLPDGSYVIKDGGQVTLGIIGEPGARKWNKINYYSPNIGVTKSIQGDGKVPTIIQFQLNPGRNDIWLDDDIERNKQIIFDENASSSINIPGVKLLAIDNNSRKEYEALLFNEEANEMIRKAYEGDVTFTKVSALPHINIRISWMDSNNEVHELNRLVVEDHKNAIEFEESMLNILNCLDKHKKGYFSIDAGPFGSLKVYPNMGINRGGGVRRGLNLGDKWRDRADNILILSRAIYKGEFTFIHKKVDPSLFCERDKKVLVKLISKGKWPSKLAAHCQTLLNEAERLIRLNSGTNGGNYNDY
ncbi:competence protein CoiA family protein [Neobacillus mesonae]|uniref:competence protein CoiA family protein n=1 Tax=Neobacillus mesonae TaxID=1193713 RepID=UPI000835425F|nr:competence protein CoiA family protein [Neobacillus mesonae]